ILPTPTVVNNVVLYTALFDVKNDDSVLLPQMTAQVFFVIAQARDVITVPLGALTFEGGNRVGGKRARGHGNRQGGGQRTAQAGQGQGGQGNGRQRGQGGGQGQNAQNGSGQNAGAQDNGQGAAIRQRMASVSFVNANGETEQRQVQIGVSDRVNA